MKLTLIILTVILLITSIKAQNQESLKSLEIIKLEKEISLGNKNAEDEFWKEIKIKGTPLVGTIENDKQNSLVTFLWRGNSETKNVLIMSPVFPWIMVRRQMMRVENSDVWYKSVTIPNNLRASYSFSENDPRLPFADPYDWNQFRVSTVNDPFNAKKFIYLKDEDNPNDESGELSLLEMPNVFRDSNTLPNENVKKGKLEKYNLDSKILKNERRVWVYTPPNYSPNKKYPLVILLDGWDYLHLIPTPTILDNLQAKGKIPPVVVVFVANPLESGVREKEFQANPSFSDFAVKELLPWIHSKYIVTNNPKHTTIGGLSFGGLAAGFVALKNSDKFGNVIMQSPSLWWGDDYYGEDGEWLTHQFVESKKLPLRFYIDVGKLEVFPSTRKGRPITLHAARHFRDVLQLKGNEVYYKEFNGAHEHINWRETLAGGLTLLLGK
jgi:enterochelin esterase family protein